MKTLYGFKYVLATHEEPQDCSCGKWPGNDFLGVALPCVRARHRFVELLYRGKAVTSQIYDVGPWCIDDEDYVFGTQKPRAETFQGGFCCKSLEDHTVPEDYTPCNGAGIDLFPATAKALGIPIGENVIIGWRFA